MVKKDYMAGKAKTDKPKNNMKRKRSQKKKDNSLKQMVTSLINKGREMKRQEIYIDEQQIGPPGQALLLSSNIPTDGVYNYVQAGTGGTQRTGAQIQPISLDFKGWMRFTSNLDSAPTADCKVRLIAGYVDDITYVSARTSFTSVQWFWNGEGVITTNDFRDITRGLNWHLIQPVYDKTFTMSPATRFNGSNVVTNPASFENMKEFRIKHKFSGKEVIKSPITTENVWQKKNFICMAWVRLASDDLAVPATNIEFVAEGGFYYHDA